MFDVNTFIEKIQRVPFGSAGDITAEFIQFLLKQEKDGWYSHVRDNDNPEYMGPDSLIWPSWHNALISVGYRSEEKIGIVLGATKHDVTIEVDASTGEIAGIYPDDLPSQTFWGDGEADLDGRIKTVKRWLAI